MLPTVLRKQMLPGFADEFFGKDLLSNLFDNERFSIPAVNISESKEDFRIEVAAPGISKKDYKLDVHNDILTIQSEKENNKVEQNVKILSREFNYNCFKRSFSLPKSANVEKIQASHKDGILLVIIPKREEAIDKGPKQIQIS